MNVASLELCKELERLSGWDVETDHPEDQANHVPAYDLGYLMRKLPGSLPWKDGLNIYLMLSYDKPTWSAYYDLDSTFEPDSVQYVISADTPEDAAAKLCIELFKQKILKPEQEKV